MMSSVSLSTPASASSEALTRAGFTPISATHYQRRALHLAIGPHWCAIEAPDSPIPLHSPGLWKRVGTGGEGRRILSLPRRIWDSAASADSSFEDETSVLDQCLQWAFATPDVFGSSLWQPPARLEVESWFKAEHLTVVTGSLLRQGEVICESGRLAIRFQLVPELPARLPASRRAWLRALLDEAQDRWHLVRLGITTDTDGQSSVVAEVDLTGVPHGIAQDLFVISLEALRWVVQWLGETTDWLADATVASELLAVCPNHQP
jgi:hypothetical protein